MPAQRTPIARVLARPAPAQSIGAALAVAGVAFALLVALTACNRAQDSDAAISADDATAEALRGVAVQTGEALAGQEGAAAPTNALGGGASAPAAEPYRLSGAESEPEAVRAAELGGLDRPLFVWFIADGCDACAEIEDEVATVRDAWSDRVGFITVDVDDPAAADVVRRLNVSGAPSFAVLYTSGAPAATFTEWPGVESFGTYLEQVLQLDAGMESGSQD